MKKFFVYVLSIFLTGIVLNAQVAAPYNLTANVENWGIKKNVKLAWQHELNAPQVLFDVYKQADNGNFVKILTKFPRKNFTDFQVFVGKSYKYYVVAKVGTTLSASSDTVTVTIEEPVILKGIIAGVVTDENTGAPISGAKLTFIPKTNFFNFVTVVSSDSLGNYSVELKEGEYYIHVAKLMYKYEYYNNVTNIRNATPVNVVASVATNINFALSPIVIPTFYTLKGKVTDELGNPLRAKVKVIIQNKGLNVARYSLTNPDGDYSIRLRKNDTVIVYASSFNFNFLPEYYDNKLTATEADVLVMSGNLENINFALANRVPFANLISGTLQDTLGNPIVGNVTAFKVKDGQMPFKVSVVSDSTGAYTLTDLLPGKYVLFACSFPNYIPTYFRFDGAQAFRPKNADTLVIESTTALNNINFTLLNRVYGGNGMISGIVNGNDKSPVQGAYVVAVNEMGKVISSAVTDANGFYNLNSLSENNYTLLVNKYDYEESTVSNIPVYQNNLYSAIANVTINPQGVTSVNESSTIPENFVLSQNYPNPFNPETTIKFSIPTQQFVSLKVYDILGNEVATLVSEVKQAGNYQVKLNGANLSSGIYFYSLKAGNFTKTLKMTLIK